MTHATAPTIEPVRVLRIGGPVGLGPLQTVMVFLVTAVLAGGALLLSAAESTSLVDGALPWQANSPLRAIVQLLCLNYEFPTTYAGEIKNYLLGLGAGLALFALTVAVLSRSQGEADEESVTTPARDRWLTTPVMAGQVLALFLLLWSFASSRWSSAPALSVGATVFVGLQYLWAFSLAHGLSARGAKMCAYSMLGVLAVASAVAIWYYYRRNSVLPAKFPLGNPSFLAASLIPGLILGLTGLIAALDRSPRRSAFPQWLAGLLCLAATIVCAWAFFLAQSRGPTVGLVFGLLAACFFAAKGRWKMLPALAAAGIAAAGAWYFWQGIDAPSPTGRSATMRFRLHAWSYAWRMFLARPITGHGQGGFALHGDSYTAGDVLGDPLAFVARVEHAHNEWLEVLSDLGLIGLVLVAGILGATLLAGQRAIRKQELHGRPWMLIGLLGALVGLIAAECFGVGLRVSGVLTFFFTVLGLVWASCNAAGSPLLHYSASTPNRRIFAGVIGGVFALAAMAVSQQDFQAARDAYRVSEAFQKGDDQQAIRYAASSLFRLNPQRVLENMYYLVEANVQAADRMLQRALDRSRRALDAEPPDGRLQLLAMEDFAVADEYVKAAANGLKQLVSASPGFIHSGALEARVNLLQAQFASAQNDAAARDAFLRNAAAAIDREIARQPYNPHLAVEYVRLAGPDVELMAMIEVLARPLRHNRIQEGYVAILAEVGKEPQFPGVIRSVAEAAQSAIQSATLIAKPDWSPEKLRIAAAAKFFDGDFASARELLETACRAYDALSGSAPIGAASCYAELADAAFFDAPLHPADAIARAGRAIDLAPSSEQGRALQTSIEQRLVQYHLAADDETEAMRLLRKSAPAGVNDDIVSRELGVRFRRLCEALVSHQLSRQDPALDAVIGDSLDRWIQRSIELSPPDAVTHYISAEIALLRRDSGRLAIEVGAALDKGLPPEAALELIDHATRNGLADPTLDRLRSNVEPLVNEAAEVLPDSTTPAEPTAQDESR